MSHIETVNLAHDTLLKIDTGECLPDTKKARRVLDYLITRGWITKTPETTPVVRLTAAGKERADAHRRSKS